ncbi:type I polyketide synthase, partial [Streptomyces daliensis]|nr:type I polyketide synthase [Streptomyces daliensis]
RALLARAHTRACGSPVAPQDIDYVEAHGTGTALGDPIEAGALGARLGAGRDSDKPLLIGSVKTNIGHLEAAAGIAGFVKTVLALHRDEIPPSLHFQRPSPHIDFEALGLRVAADPEPWPRYSGTATAGVSAFGFGGTNAHVVLQEHQPPARPAPHGDTGAEERRARDQSRDREGRAPALLLLDGPTEDRTREYAARLAEWLGTPRGRATHPYDLGRTLTGRTGRGRFRAAVVAGGACEAAEALSAYAEGRPTPLAGIGDGQLALRHTGGPVWVFSGYGSQWPGMARRLLAAEPAFAAAVDRLEPLLRAHAGLSLREHLRPEAELATTDVVMPVLFGIQVALAELWRAHGVEPAAVVGHSMGEVAAAVAAGGLDAEDGARVIALRSRLLARLTGGAMAAVELAAAEVRALAERFPTVELAVHASPTQCVVTGSDQDIDGIVRHVTERGGLARALPVTVAGHSPHVDPLLPELTAGLADLCPQAPAVPFYSTVLDPTVLDPTVLDSSRDPAAPEPPVFDADYWAANLRRPVRFAQAVTAAAEDGHRTFVEISPHPTQLHPLSETLRAADAGASLLVPTLRRDGDDARTFRTALATLYAHGAEPRTGELHPGGLGAVR